jgi:von Willebrand factor type A domain/Domain of unknown function DUF11
LPFKTYGQSNRAGFRKPAPGGLSKRLELQFCCARHAPGDGRRALSKIAARLLPLLLLCHLFAGGAGAQQPNPLPNLNVGDAVATGFSGTIALDPTRPRSPNKSVVDLTFINPDGPSARIVGVGRPGYAWDGRLFAAPKTFDAFAKDTGQVFGVALDDQPAPNIYLAATSAFGLNLVGRGRDGLPERRKIGSPGTGWMKGQFGLDLQGDPGSIYKVDGTTGVVTLFAKVMLDGVPNPGPALGNLAYDAAHKQLFVSDLYTGMIHRFATADGSELGAPYNHGVTGRSAANLAPVPFNPANRPNIANNRFNSENPDSWGFAPPERRVWGLAVQTGRLFYSARNGAATDGPQIWSVGIAQDGSFGTDVRLEVEVAAQPGPYPVSDIAFSQKGAMILAQRAPIAGSYDYSAFTRPGEPRVLRYWLKDANDPPSPGLWKPMPEEYAVGFAGTYRNTDGGVALGYGYGQDGTLSGTACEAALWTTGQSLRNNPALRRQLEPGGPLVVNGLQGSPADMVRSANEPPAVSYYIDYDDKFDDASASGHMGSVRILARPCATAVAGGAGSTSSPPYVSGPQTGGGGVTPTPTTTPTPKPIDLKIGKENTPAGGPGNAFHIWVTNVGGPITFSAGGITVTDAIPVGMTVTSATGPNWTCVPATVVGFGNLTCTYNLAGSLGTNVAILDVITVHAVITGTGTLVNCATVAIDPASGVDTDPTNNTACVPVTTIVKPIDVGIAKTGVIVPPDLPVPGVTNTSYSLVVTNVGAAFAGNGAIVVSDPAPAGVTYTGVSWTALGDWACTFTASAVNCNYIGNGPTSVGALLGTIKVTATASGDGPWMNCATVAVDAGAGTDSDPTNNQSCVTLTKGGFIPVNHPPEISPTCGMDVLFVVDESRSIADANATSSIMGALTTAAGILNTNGSKAALVRFSNNALVVQNWSTATYSSLNTGYNPMAGGGTNWEAAMVAAKGLLPHTNAIIIFITDGVPTAFLDNSGAVQFTTDSILATNEAIPVVNDIYGFGVPIIGIGIGGISTHLNALLGGNVYSTTYGGVGTQVQNIARTLCPKLYLTKQVVPNYINYFYTPAPQQVTITLKLTNTTAAAVNANVQDALPPELTSPTLFSASLGTASGNPVNWTIPGLASGATATLTFKATVSPSTPPPTDTSWKCYKNFAQVMTVNGVAEDSTHLMANPVTGPVHEQDEASDQVCVQTHEYTNTGGDCGTSYLWVTKKTAFSEICVPDGSPACKFNITVTAMCKAFNGPVLFGDGVFSGSSAVSPTITSITNNASPSICAWSSGWSSTTSPSYCTANISLPLNQSIVFTVTLGAPLPPLAPGASYTNCFVADGKTPVPANFPAAYADVHPNTNPNGGMWGNCAPFNVQTHAALICPPGTTRRGADCVQLPPVACVPPMVPGAVAGQCICPPGTRPVGNTCEGPPPPTCKSPMIPGPLAGQCICPAGTVQKGRECVRPIVCRAPLIPNAAGTDCVCPQGSVQRGKECIRQPVCNLPAKLNRRGACECPTDMVAKGNSCVERERRTPGISPGDIIRITPGGGRDNPRGGGRDNPGSPRGGGQSPTDLPGRR